MLKDCYTVKDIAEALQVKEKAIRQLITTGELKATKILNKWIVTAEHFEFLLNPAEKITECEQCKFFSIAFASTVKDRNTAKLKKKIYYCEYYKKDIHRIADDLTHHIVNCTQEKK